MWRAGRPPYDFSRRRYDRLTNSFPFFEQIRIDNNGWETYFYDHSILTIINCLGKRYGIFAGVEIQSDLPGSGGKGGQNQEPGDHYQMGQAHRRVNPL
jgi:hypothetical protein